MTHVTRGDNASCWSSNFQDEKRKEKNVENRGQDEEFKKKKIEKKEEKGRKEERDRSEEGKNERKGGGLKNEEVRWLMDTGRLKTAPAVCPRRWISRLNSPAGKFAF